MNYNVFYYIYYIIIIKSNLWLKILRLLINAIVRSFIHKINKYNFMKETFVSVTRTFDVLTFSIIQLSVI